MRPTIGNRQKQPIRVFIVDDSDIVQERLVELLGEVIGIEIAGRAGTASTAIVGIQKLKPDAVILDLHLPGDSGVAVLKTIKQGPAAPVVIVLTNHVSPAYRRQCRQAGADYFLDKSTEFDRLPHILAGLNLVA